MSRISFQEAVEGSISKWEKVLAAYPDVELEGVQPDEKTYGHCGLCRYFGGDRLLWYSLCSECPLYPEYCSQWKPVHSSAGYPLYWGICARLSVRKPCKRMIKKMLKKLCTLAELEDPPG